MDRRIIILSIIVCIAGIIYICFSCVPFGEKIDNKIELDEDEDPIVTNNDLTTDSRSVAIGVTWTPASDMVPQERLEYRVVCSESPNINTLKMALENLDETKSSTWIKGVSTADAVNLVPLTLYYVNVLVRDRAGNMAAYKMTSDTTVQDLIAPTLEVNGDELTKGIIEEESFDISWIAAEDNITPQNLLQYNVYYTDDPDVDLTDVVGEITASSTGWNTYTTTEETVDIGLEDDTTYYVNVLVRDEGDNRTAYTPTEVTTDKYPRIYWTEYAQNRIRSAKLDGGDPEVIITLAGGSYPYALALDLDNRIMYWSEHGNDQITSADMDDGTPVVDLITSNAGDIYGIAFDSRNNTLYWTSGNSIFNAPVDTDDPNANNHEITSLNSFIDSGNFLYGIALDEDNNKLYWVESDNATGADSRICSADITTDNPPVVSNPALFYNNSMMLPRAIAVDTYNDNIFWSDEHTVSPYPRISKINTSAEPASFVASITSNLTAVHGIVSFYDTSVPASYFFWTDDGRDNIYKALTSANVDDANNHILLSSSGSDPVGIAIDF
ncbi:MAG: hypothetical protein JXJ04_09930 [Spirochaetales bacterium]|nr:hypothetical protein [Spirochaetales bacterium]